MITIIKNADIVTTDGVLSGQNIVIRDGIIAGIGKESCKEKQAQVIDAKGCYVFPGFIDEHVHGGGGADFMDGDAEAFEKAVKAHLKHGTTLLLPTAMTASEDDLVRFIENFKEFKATSPYASNTLGVHLEGPYFSNQTSKSAGAQKPSLMRAPDEREINRILDVAEGMIVRWDAAPEVCGSELFAKKMKENKIICSIAHSAATSEQAQKGIDNGFSHVTHCYNAVTTYHKKDQVVCAGVVEAAYLNENVFLEFICDGKHIPRDIIRVALKVKGKERVMGITDGIRIAGTELKSARLGNKDIGTDVIVDDGVAKLPDLSSFAGSIATMDRCLSVLCKDYGFDVSIAVSMLSETPAKHLGVFDKKGSIEKGKDADLVITDVELNVKQVLSGGKLVCA